MFILWKKTKMAVVGGKRKIICIYELMLSLRYSTIHDIVFDIHLTLTPFAFL